MTTLDEIEKAAAALTAGQQAELLLFLAGRLRDGGRPVPPPRALSAEQVSAWISADEADAARLDAEA